MQIKFGKKTKIVSAVLLVLLILPVLGVKFGCPAIAAATANEQEQQKSKTSDIEKYNRTEESSYLTYPEWAIVYSSEEYANWLQTNKPSSFPYFRSVGQYWASYCSVYEITKQQYGFNMGNHLMLWVIGTSYTFENVGKGIYENTIGRITETDTPNQTSEENFAAEFNKEYVTLIYDLPWYEFNFTKKLGQLWGDVPFFGNNLTRKFERRIFLNTELSLKAVYGALIKFATHSLYGVAETEIYATIKAPSENIFSDPLIKKIQDDGNGQYTVLIPRYRLFTEMVPKMVKQGVTFEDVAGNDEIFLTALAPREWNSNLENSQILFSQKILTKPETKRLGIKAEVRSLHLILEQLERENVKLEHLYDY